MHASPHLHAAPHWQLALRLSLGLGHVEHGHSPGAHLTSGPQVHLAPHAHDVLRFDLAHSPAVQVHAPDSHEQPPLQEVLLMSGGTGKRREGEGRWRGGQRGRHRGRHRGSIEEASRKPSRKASRKPSRKASTSRHRHHLTDSRTQRPTPHWSLRYIAAMLQHAQHLRRTLAVARGALAGRAASGVSVAGGDHSRAAAGLGSSAAGAGRVALLAGARGALAGVGGARADVGGTAAGVSGGGGNWCDAGCRRGCRSIPRAITSPLAITHLQRPAVGLQAQVELRSARTANYSRSHVDCSESEE